MGDVSDHEVGHLLDRWKQGDRDDAGWFRALRLPMRRGAWLGIQRMTGQPPNDDDVGEVLYDAFMEFLRLDPNTITSPVGLPVSIAHRRGQDMGRRMNRGREFPDSDRVTVQRNPSQGGQGVVLQELALGPEDVLLQAENEEEKERVLALALECLEELPPGQAEVVRATIMNQQNISDWANEQGKSYQAADQQRNRALAALRRCIDNKRHEKGGDHVVR